MDLKLTGLQGDVMKESMNVAKTLAWKLTTKTQQKKLTTTFEKTKLQLSRNSFHSHIKNPLADPAKGFFVFILLVN